MTTTSHQTQTSNLEDSARSCACVNCRVTFVTSRVTRKTCTLALDLNCGRAAVAGGAVLALIDTP